MLTARDAKHITEQAKGNPLNKYELLIESRAREGFSTACVEGFIDKEHIRILEARGFVIDERRGCTFISW